MSVKAVSWYLDNSEQDGPRLLALLSLAEWSDDGGSCYPSMASIAKRLRRSERTAQAVIAELEEAGELLVVPGAGMKVQGGYLTRYYLLRYMDANNAPIPPEHASLAADRRHSDREHGHQGMQKRNEGVKIFAPVIGTPEAPEEDEGVQETTPLHDKKRGAGFCKGVQVSAQKGCENLHPNRQKEPSVKTTLSLSPESDDAKPAKRNGQRKEKLPPEVKERREKLRATWQEETGAQNFDPGQVNKGIEKLDKAGCKPEELVGCIRWMKGDDYWENKNIYPQSIFKKLDEYRREAIRRPSLNGASAPHKLVIFNQYTGQREERVIR